MPPPTKRRPQPCHPLVGKPTAAGSTETILSAINNTQHDLHDQPAAAATEAVAIEISDVSKTFVLTHDQSSTVKDWVVQRASRKQSVPKVDTKQVRALKPLSFDIYQGETFGIMGHNGSGKSTLLKVVAGVIRPSTGRVRARGTISALLELGAGFHPDLTGRENIFLNASILGFSKEYVNSIYDEIVDFSEIGEFIDMQVRFYSSGMRARLGFSVATNLEPDILLVDEVLAVGDEKFRAKCMERIQRFRKMKHTMVIVSHGPERVRELCDRAAVLDHGELLFVGDSEKAIEVYRAALYGTSRSGTTTATKSAQDSDTAQDTAPGQNADPAQVSERIEGFALTEAMIEQSERPDGVFAPGDHVSFSVAYASDRERKIQLSVAIKGRNGEVVIRQSTVQIIGGPVAVTPGRGHLSFTLNNLPLLDDVYSFTFVARDADSRRELDRIGQGPRFTVEGPGARLGRVVADITLNQPAEVDLDDQVPRAKTQAAAHS